MRFRSFDGAASTIQQSADLNALIQWLFDRGLNKSPLIIGYYFYCITTTVLLTTVLLLDDYLLYYHCALGSLNVTVHTVFDRY